MIQRSLYPYTPFLQEVLAAFKYRGDAALAEIFCADLRKLAFQVHKRADLIVPIPLHPDRLFERGFNQAELLAESFQTAEILEKTKASKKQSKSRPGAREENASGAFSLKKGIEVQGKKILLLDDIYTTGATLYAAAAPLWEAGASAVCGVTAARAVQKK
ncbi:ComF family protein [Alkalicoccus daliensis]|uniref:ComF family protein n=1 Tax=Alkalicoccus daliensis TaxID=745820 RepID=A0A1H0J1Y9_9BACI|nr:ComF family protein [Alkalicoccus daliensis]SDO37563.1 comF family protein [Alkalicoccus daliensis]